MPPAPTSDALRRRIDGPERVLSAAHSSVSSHHQVQTLADEPAIAGRMLGWYGRCAPYVDVAMTLALAASAALLYWVAFGHPSGARAPSSQGAPVVAPATAAGPSDDARLGLPNPPAPRLKPMEEAPAWPEAPSLALDDNLAAELQGAPPAATDSPGPAESQPPAATASASATDQSARTLYVPAAYPTTAYRDFTVGQEFLAALAAAKGSPSIAASPLATESAPPVVATLPEPAEAAAHY
jgi:hypothetical protein